jgi:hypothetical protein
MEAAQGRKAGKVIKRARPARSTLAAPPPPPDSIAGANGAKTKVNRPRPATHRAGREQFARRQPPAVLLGRLDADSAPAAARLGQDCAKIMSAGGGGAPSRRRRQGQSVGLAPVIAARQLQRAEPDVGRLGALSGDRLGGRAASELGRRRRRRSESARATNLI